MPSYCSCRLGFLFGRPSLAVTMMGHTLSETFHATYPIAALRAVSASARAFAFARSIPSRLIPLQSARYSAGAARCSRCARGVRLALHQGLGAGSPHERGVHLTPRELLGQKLFGDPVRTAPYVERLHAARLVAQCGRARVDCVTDEVWRIAQLCDLCAQRANTKAPRALGAVASRRAARMRVCSTSPEIRLVQRRTKVSRRSSNCGRSPTRAWMKSPQSKWEKPPWSS